MFRLFKKRGQEPPPVASKNQQFQNFFATKWVQSALASSVAGFSGAVLCGDGDKLITNAWKKMWVSNFPNDPMMPPDGLAVTQFHERGHLVVFITFPPSQSVGGVYFGVVVIGPCEDPQWRPEARQRLPFRYFVLSRAASGTSVDEWTADPPHRLGAGPEPEPQLFTEWVLNHAVKPTADMTVTVRKEITAAAIERARRELPAVLQRFIAGELHGAHFTVKVPITNKGAVEHFWLSDTTYADGYFFGIIDADPQDVSNVKRGDRWKASLEEVTDWMYTRDEKMFGNYTIRAMLPNLPPHEAAKYRAILSDEQG
jgi:uncharacterized protein YegJ (DUF2314 family)